MANEQTAVTATADGQSQQQPGQTQTGLAEGQKTGTAQATNGAGGTIITGDGATPVEPAKIETPATWPADWREKMSNGDSKLMERLKRFTDPSGVVNWATEAEKKISSGLLKRGLPEGASPEEVAAYRKEIGIPEEADKYPLEAPKEITLSDADKPILEGFRKFAHGNAIEPKVAQEITNWFLANRENELQDFREAADQAVQDRVVELRTEMGADYPKNVTLGNNFIAEVMGEKGPALAGLTLSDGTKLGSHPDFVRFVAQAARTYTTAEMQLGGGADGVNVESRINDIKALMKDQRGEYWKGPKAESLQAEYRNLIERRDRQKSRAA